MDAVRSVLPAVLRKRGLQQVASASLVVHLSQQWLERELPHLRDAIAVRTYADATLTIGCSHSIALQECRLVLDELQAMLSRECPTAVIQDIRLQRAEKKR